MLRGLETLLCLSEWHGTPILNNCRLVQVSFRSCISVVGNCYISRTRDGYTSDDTLVRRYVVELLVMRVSHAVVARRRRRRIVSSSSDVLD